MSVTANDIGGYLAAGKAAGCPPDQMLNFVRAGCVLWPKQLIASATARMCDHPDGPTKLGYGGSRGGAKALALDTPLPTPIGLSTMGEVEPGDYLLDEHHKPCRVLGISDVMEGHEVFRVWFSDGSAIDADAGHLWLTATHEERWRRGPQTVRTTREILETLKYAGIGGPSANHAVRIPTADANRPWLHWRFIVSVYPIPSVPVKCVMVDSPSHLFLAGYGEVPTHNSHWLLAQMALDDCQRYPGLKCLMLRKLGKTNKEAFDDLSRKIFTVVQPHFSERPTPTASFGNGSRIVLGNFKDESDIENYLGIEYDIIGIEESTTLSEKKKRDIRGSLRTSKPNWRPREYHTTNPGGVSHGDFKKQFILPWRNRSETDTRFIQATVDDNPAVNKEYRKNLEAYTGWQRRAWLEGDWDIEAGQYFSNFRYEDHVDCSDDFRLPSYWDVWGALDYGLRHYTVFYLMARSDDGHIWAIDEHAERGWVPEQHAEAIMRMLARYDVPYERLLSVEAGHDCFQIRQDGQSVATVADQYAKHGIKLSRANIDRVDGALELFRRLGNKATRTEKELYIPGTITIRDHCPGLIECIPSLQRSTVRPEDVQKVDADDDTGEGGDDFYDSFRFGYMKFGPSKVNSCPSIVGPRRDFSMYLPR